MIKEIVLSGEFYLQCQIPHLTLFLNKALKRTLQLFSVTLDK